MQCRCIAQHAPVCCVVQKHSGNHVPGPCYVFIPAALYSEKKALNVHTTVCLFAIAYWKDTLQAKLCFTTLSSVLDGWMTASVRSLMLTPSDESSILLSSREKDVVPCSPMRTATKVSRTYNGCRLVVPTPCGNPLFEYRDSIQYR